MKRFCLLCLVALLMGQVVSAETLPSGLSLYGAPKYNNQFTHFDYVNPQAPKGGRLVLPTFGTFDTFNPFILNGQVAPGAELLFSTLMAASLDEPFSMYALVAEKVKVEPNQVTFYLNPKARFHDGERITAEDVVFSFDTLKTKGLPQYRVYYADVERAQALSDTQVRFHLRKDAHNKELPLILGQMPVLSKKYFADKDFLTASLEAPIGSGPYKIKEFEPNRFVTYQRDPNYWGAELPSQKGQYNFDEIRYDVYRDTTVAVEAFTAGMFDVRFENEAKKWATAYDIPAVQDGRIIKKEFEHHTPSGVQGFVFNTRRPLFADKRVRRALSLVFDFNWTNQHLFYGAYKRMNSFFANSDLEAPVVVEEKEKPLLRAFHVDEGGYALPDYPAGQLRPAFEEALSLLKQAGWTIQEGRLVNQDGQPFEFEILLDASGAAAWERITLPFINNLKRIGIKAHIRTLDILQYKTRLEQFDYDMIVTIWGQSLSPGNEQAYFWGSQAATQEGGYNFAGIQEERVDALIARLIQAQTREELRTVVHVLDRVLLQGYYVILHWFSPVQHVLYWDKFGMPEQVPLQGISLMTWWAK